MNTIIRNGRAYTVPAPDHVPFGSVGYRELHPDTLPDAIADAQRRDVSAAVRSLGTTDPAGLSAAVVLPVWSVRRRLAELGLGPEVVDSAHGVHAARAGGRPFGQGRPLANRRHGDVSPATAGLIRGWLAANGPATAARIADGVGRSATTVRTALCGVNGFEVVAVAKKRSRRPARLWAVKGAK